MTHAIFYVDDDSDDLTFFKDACDSLGAQVKLFDLGNDLLQAMENPPPEPKIIFLDLNMPIKSGYEILAEIRGCASYHEIPLIVFSTAGDDENVKKCHALGANYYFVKPTSMKLMTEMVSHALTVDWTTFAPNMKEFVYCRI